MPKLIENKEKKFNLFLNKDRCGGCEVCIAVCPTGILEISNELNYRIAYIPRVKENKAKSCTGCRRCELCCPDWCIYVIEKEIQINNSKM